MLMKAERQTMTMVRTPTMVLFILDWTIPLERVCSDTGKSCGQPDDDVVSLGPEDDFQSPIVWQFSDAFAK